MAVVEVHQDQPMLCRVCLAVQPADCFYRKYRGDDSQRTNECKSCCAARRRSERNKLRAKRDRRKMLVSLGQIARAKTDAQVRLATKLMFASFDFKIERLAEAWQVYFDEAMKQKGYGGLRAMIAFVKLLQSEEQIRREQEANMTLEEIQDALFPLVDDWIEECPGRAAAIMRAAGWQVKPPPGQRVQPITELCDA